MEAAETETERIARFKAMTEDERMAEMEKMPADYDDPTSTNYTGVSSDKYCRVHVYYDLGVCGYTYDPKDPKVVVETPAVNKVYYLNAEGAADGTDTLTTSLCSDPNFDSSIDPLKPTNGGIYITGYNRGAKPIILGEFSMTGQANQANKKEPQSMENLDAIIAAAEAKFVIGNSGAKGKFDVEVAKLVMIKRAFSPGE